VRVIPIAGSLDLGKDVPSGPYVLEVTVARAREGKVNRHASQWVDFEVRYQTPQFTRTMVAANGPGRSPDPPRRSPLLIG
jgi:hypothetical protein